MVAPFITAAEVLGLPVDGAAPRLAVVGAASLYRTPLYLREWLAKHCSWAKSAVL